MYDDTCKFLAEHFSADFASWLLGETVTLTEIQPSELSLDPIRADAMILLQSEDSILHLEFQTIPKENIPFRMLDYRVRGNRRYKGKSDGCLCDPSWVKIRGGRNLSLSAESHYARIRNLPIHSA
jgi:predicted transposase/invertase (TIGR01784 family)